MAASQITEDVKKGSDAEIANSSTSGYAYESAADSIVAFAGGGQASGTQLTKQINRVVTVATAADSVKLPLAEPGLILTVTNAHATNSLNVFPATGDAINAIAANSAFAVAATKTCQFSCVTAGRWHSLLSA